MRPRYHRPREIPTVEQLTVEQLTAELDREIYRSRYRRVLRSTVYALVVVAAVAVLVATIWMPVLQVYGNSMTPTLDKGDIVICVKSSDAAPGDVLAFYYNNKILVKRCIAGPGQWVDIDENGNVYVDGERLIEPYLTEPALGECNIALPYQVPECSYFCMGDNRPACGFQKHGDRLCGRGTNRRETCIPGLAFGRFSDRP